MLPRHALVSAILMGLSLLCASPASAQTTLQQVPQTQGQGIIPPEWKPDLRITSMTITTSCVAQQTVTANIAVTIKNESQKATANLAAATWNIIAEANWWPQTSQTILENPQKKTVMPQVGGPKALKPGQTWSTTLTIVGIPKYKKLNNTAPLVYYFEVKVDPSNAVAEANEGNNKWMKTAPDACFKP